MVHACARPSVEAAVACSAAFKVLVMLFVGTTVVDAKLRCPRRRPLFLQNNVSKHANNCYFAYCEKALFGVVMGASRGQSVGIRPPKCTVNRLRTFQKIFDGSNIPLFATYYSTLR